MPSEGSNGAAGDFDQRFADSVSDSIEEIAARPTCRPPLPSFPHSVNLIRGLRAILSSIILLLTAYLGTIFLQGPLIPLSSLAPRWFRYIVDTTILSWMMLAELVIGKVLGVRVRHFGDRFLSSGASTTLCLLNHRTELDWLFAWGLGDPLQQMKIILKESLAQVPGAGWAMQCAGFVFLRRQLATDRERIRNQIDYFKRSKGSFQLLIFPEGTNLKGSSLMKSDEFAEKSDLPYARYTLHPRIAGLFEVINALGTDCLADIYDVTVAYPDRTPSELSHFVFGQVPSEVHYLVTRYPCSTLYTSGSELEPDQITRWIRDRWAEKEARLKHYYSLPVDQRHFDHELIPDSRVFRQSLQDSSLRTTWLGFLNGWFWTVGTLCSVYWLCTSWTVLAYALFIQLVFVLLTAQPGGINAWAARWI